MLVKLTASDTGKMISLPYHVTAEKSYDMIYIYNQKAFSLDSKDSIRSKENMIQEIIYEYGNLKKENSSLMDISFRVVRIKDINPNDYFRFEKTYCIKYFDCDKINGILKLRYPMKGDYMYIGNDKIKKLSRVFIDEKVPRDEREKLLVLADGNHVLWIPDYDKVSTRTYVSETTKKILLAEIGGIA
jgi:tRNA(Ile)-lysidine synthase